MSKLLIALSFIAVVIAHEAPTPEQMKEHLVKEGISETAADGLVAIGQKYKDQFTSAKGDKEAMKKLFGEIKTESEAYIKTQSEADQTAYAAFVEKKMAKWQSHQAGTQEASA